LSPGAVHARSWATLCYTPNPKPLFSSWWRTSSTIIEGRWVINFQILYLPNILSRNPNLGSKLCFLDTLILFFTLFLNPLLLLRDLRAIWFLFLLQSYLLSRCLAGALAAILDHDILEKEEWPGVKRLRESYYISYKWPLPNILKREKRHFHCAYATVT
jgi:hypothetical protein